MLLSASLDGCVKLWDPRTGSAAAASLTNHTPAAVHCVAAGAGGALIAAGTREGRVFVWDVRLGAAPMAECRGHGDQITKLVFAPSAASHGLIDGQCPLLFSASRDWTVRSWDADNGICRSVHVGHAGAVTSLAVLIDDGISSTWWGDTGRPVHQQQLRVLTGGEDGSLGMWLANGELRALQQVHKAPLCLVAIASAGGSSMLVTGAADGACSVWSSNALLAGAVGGGLPPPLSALQGRRALVANGCMAFDPVAKLVVGGHRDGSITAWSSKQ